MLGFNQKNIFDSNFYTMNFSMFAGTSPHCPLVRELFYSIPNIYPCQHLFLGFFMFFLTAFLGLCCRLLKRLLVRFTWSKCSGLLIGRTAHRVYETCPVRHHGFKTDQKHFCSPYIYNVEKWANNHILHRSIALALHCNCYVLGIFALLNFL